MQAAVRPSLVAKVAVAVGAGLAIPTFIQLVRVWGHRIPQPNIEADYLAGLVWAVVLALALAAIPFPVQDRRALLTLWGAKCVVTLGFMLLYEWNYPLDSFGYFSASRGLLSPFEGGWWGDGTQNMRSLVWLHARVLPDSYHVLKVTWAMVGLLAIYLFYRAAARFRGVEDTRLLYVLGLFPSILFWSSTLGKDPLQLLGIALYVYGVVGMRRSARWYVYLVPLALGVLFSAYIRLWSAVILILPLVVFVFKGIRGVGARIVFLTLLGYGFARAVNAFALRFGLATLSDVYGAADTLSRGWEGGSSLERAAPITSVGDMVRFAPVGAFTALFRPLPGEVMNPFGIIAGLEGFCLLALAGLALVRARPRHFGEPLIAWALLLVVTWATLYGFVSANNLGAAARFKLQILPVLLLLVLHLAFDTRTRGAPVPPKAQAG